MNALARRLTRPGPFVAAELRPPRSGLAPARSMDVWIDMHHSLQRLARAGASVLLTDDAVGSAEEESLAHLAANMGDAAGFDSVIPFLTCKHSLDYCRLFARRAASLGVAGLAVVGGDESVGPPRCVRHGQELRRLIRQDQPGLALAGWANPHRSPDRQAHFVAAPEFAADFVLTQVVSHHSLDRVERLRRALARLDVALPVVWGVFLYRSANPRTLERLGRFFPVPAAQVAREFREGARPEEICARSIRALREAGADKVYVSNLGSRDAAGDLARVLEAVERG